MPKEKRRNVTGNSTRHAPLGQVIADDENRSKFATVRSRPRGADSSKLDDDGEEVLLDEKTSRAIFALGKEQLLEIEMEEQQELQRRSNKKKSINNSSSKNDDSSDEEEDDNDSGSIIGELADEEE